MQIEVLHQEIDRRQAIHGDASLCSVYGTGCIKNPRVMFVFMNPTGRNVSTNKTWQGIRASWLGTKNIWHLFNKLKLISDEYFTKTQKLSPADWTENFAREIYTELKNNGVFITNLAKCTQVDARPLKDRVFKDYLDLIKQEILAVNPQNIISFGNQVSSIILGKAISVSQYPNKKSELLKIGNKKFNVFPTYYPIGRGRMNLPLAVKRIEKILKSNLTK